MRVKLFAALAGVFLLTACSGEDMTLDESLKPRAQAAYNQLALDQVDALFASMDPSFNTPQQRQTVKVMENFIPAGETATAKMVGWRTNVSIDGSRQQVVNYRYDYPSTSLVFSTTFNRTKSGAPWTVLGINIAPADDSLKAAKVLDQGPAASVRPAAVAP